MRRLTGREITIVAVGAALAIVVVLVLVFFRPAVARLQAAQRQVAASSQQLSQDQSTAARLPQAKAQHAATVAALQRAEQQIPSDLALPQIVALLVQGIDGAGGQFVQLEFPQGVPATALPGSPLVQALSFTMIVRGTWPQIIEFLHTTEGLPRLIAVDSVSVTKEPLQQGAAPTVTPILRAELSLRAFALR
ncbi:MAG TPA: type 4a pilus biogenesis protein PilO [bacterium]|nr:type 4a pilus biogenesis protein PilO [bacterium]